MKILTPKKAIVQLTASLLFSALSSAPTLAAVTMYNGYLSTLTPPAAPANPEYTDGWMWNDGPQNGNSAGAVLNPWYGTAGENTNPSDPRPFNFSGSSATNWAVHFTQAGDSAQISTADSFARYGIYADIDTSGGTWRDSSATPTGRSDNTDIGLFKSDVTQQVKLTVNSNNGIISTFGITLFTGMDTSTNIFPPNFQVIGYSHHMPWNTHPTLFTRSNPFGTSGVDYVGGLGVDTPGNASYMVGITAINGFTFTAQAGQIYSIYLGGYGGVNWNQQHDGYALNLSSAPVPIPGAAWLMGSGLIGLLGLFQRSKAIQPSRL